MFQQPNTMNALTTAMAASYVQTPGTPHSGYELTGSVVAVARTHCPRRALLPKQETLQNERTTARTNNQMEVLFPVPSFPYPAAQHPSSLLLPFYSLIHCFPLWRKDKTPMSITVNSPR